MLIGVACTVSLKYTLLSRLSVLFTIRENFRKFAPNTKFPVIPQSSETWFPIKSYTEDMKLKTFGRPKRMLTAQVRDQQSFKGATD